MGKVLLKRLKCKSYYYIIIVCGKAQERLACPKMFKMTEAYINLKISNIKFKSILPIGIYISNSLLSI